MKTMEYYRDEILARVKSGLVDKRQAWYDKYDTDDRKWFDNIPERFRKVFRDGTVDESRVSPVVKQYCQDKAWKQNSWIVLAGLQSGKGKSFDACYILSKYVEDTESGFLWEMPERIVSDMIDSNYLLESYKKASLLVIDDFDKFKASEGDNAFKKNLMHELIDYRMDVKMRPTIITANADWKTLEEIYTPYIVRRIKDACGKYIAIK